MTDLDVRIRPYTWRDYNTATGIPGVLLTRGKAYMFIPDTNIRTTADALHDHADTHETTRSIP